MLCISSSGFSFNFVGFELLQELATYENIYSRMTLQEYDYFKRVSKDNHCGLIISGTLLEEINDSTVWRDCHNLNIVIFYMNRLTKLPSELSEFNKTITLVCIQNNNFQEVPDILYEFKKLEHLNMHGNYLSRIPDDITIFRHLSRLYLGDNDIISLPNIFDQLPKLKKASFENNCLSRLPPTFENLGELETLNLARNNFVIFPPALLKLKSLKILNIERNRIHTFDIKGDSVLLDAISSFFQDLFHLQIKGNPLYLKLKIYADKKSYLLEGLRDKISLQHIHKAKLSRSLRVNVLGNSGAGKSSLVQALTIQKYVVPTSRADHRHTVGIERHFLPLDINGKTVVLHIWDYAGDDEYAMMNDLFITNGSLVWLVVNLAKYEHTSENDSDETVFYRNVGSWLLQIMSHSENPIVWIVCTHKDKCRNDQKVNQKIDKMRQYTEKLCKEQGEGGVPKILMENIKYIKLTNTYGFAGSKKIIDELNNLSSSDVEWIKSRFSDTLDLQWIKNMDLLQKQAEDKITESQPPVITDKANESLSDWSKFLSYYHDVGEIFKMKEISKDHSLVILSPQWLISLLKQVYRHDFDQYFKRIKSQPEFKFNKAEYLLDNVPETRKESGIISEPVLKALWKCHENDNLFERIIELFKEFNLTLLAHTKVSGAPMSYFFPYLMRKSKMEEELVFPESGNTIVLRCALPHFSARLFLQRLALKFWEEDLTDIYNNGFKTTVEHDVRLHVLQIKRNYSDDLRFQFCSGSDTDLLWEAVSQKLQQIYDFLSSFGYLPKSDSGELSVYLSRCKCNVYIPLRKMDDKCYKDTHNYALMCKKCQQATPMVCVVPKSTLKLHKIYHSNIETIATKREFVLFLKRNHKDIEVVLSNYAGISGEQSSFVSDGLFEKPVQVSDHQ